MKEGRQIHVSGIVQGVGFRPFVYGLATTLDLTGWVRNTSSGVDIEVDGAPQRLAQFVHALTTQAPPLAQIDGVTVEERPCNTFTRFEIIHSAAQPDAFQPISPDVSVCPDCLRELFDPTDRRYRYPFINCTHCGPRFTIIKDIPYDRPLTTMAGFAMCPDCAAEYHDPANRRFHAQPVACPACGPRVWLEASGQYSVNSNQSSQGRSTQYAIRDTQNLLVSGGIVAIKGLGGFHLACDATNETAVAELRRRKLRREKPFAVMMPDLETVRRHCAVSDAAAELLTSRARPIVILERLPESIIATAVAPGQTTIGVMLPYTPLHYLLFEQSAVSNQQPAVSGQPVPDHRPPTPALVMTSGNLSEEPIAYTNEEARERLAPLADAFLMHDRDIHVRCDDSVMRVIRKPYPVSRNPNTEHGIRNTEYGMPIRRSRGYAPFPVRLPWDAPPILGAGAELKNTFCLTNGRYAFLSHHIGDLENYETLQSFEEGVAHFERLFRVTPAAIAYDLHPNYLATRYALERAAREGIPAAGVQHHHAHVAACMAEHGLDGSRPVLGVVFDGTGYGDDGTIWGGEFLVSDYAKHERPFHLKPVPLPGGDLAVREPWRIALAHLHQAGIPWNDDLPPVAYGLRHTEYGIRPLAHQLTTRLNAPLTSSMGRLFDAVAALLGVRQTVNYEAQAAIELEALADPRENGRYPLHIAAPYVDPAPMFAAIVAELRRGTAVATIAARFHNTLAQLVVDVCLSLREETGLAEVALSGGVWQNVTLLTKTIPLLETAAFTVYTHRQVPPNDGGLALGQAAIAAYRQSKNPQISQITQLEENNLRKSAQSAD